jgi:hypothetical protein
MIANQTDLDENWLRQSLRGGGEEGFVALEAENWRRVALYQYYPAVIPGNVAQQGAAADAASSAAEL